ncbi:MAG TPA: bifunctional homocysteine S-methyltransferase/methylenetetrahydrofolate reductase [Gemmatimonadales bacterium]|nr:bifunctional homocysteine S-methyltransferase/methylenetetrahydrofolate reductase [Gemmatimonadales bacterium]
MPTFRDLLNDGRVHVFDGAMGTMLYARGVFVNVCYDELNLKQPGLVQEVHEAYVRAGAEILETNTFGANPVKLSAYGLEEQTEEINRAAVGLAKRAARGRALVVGAIGPLGIRIEPWGPTATGEAVEHFKRQASGLAEAGVDGFLLETFSDLEELHAALAAVRTLSDLPVVAQMTVGEDGNTSYGTAVEILAARLTEWPTDVIGLNCSVGPAPMLDAIERMAAVTTRPLSAQPNAGLPRAVGDRRIYLASPEYMAQYARRLIQAGVRFIGGCCGTTPEHIRRIRECVAGTAPRRIATLEQPAPASTPAPGRDPVPLAKRSRWGGRLAAGEFVTCVEIVPPRGWNPAEMLEHCRTLKVAGVDAVNVLDGPRAQSRMGVLPAALIIEREVGIETIFHYTCRDRNMLGMLSDLLGAAAGGLRNVLIVTGDPPSAGPYPDATAVFDIDSIGLTNVVHRLNRGLDPGGNPLDQPTRFVIGVALNQSAVDPERELERFAWKLDAGAEFAVTQPVFDPEQLARVLERARPSIPVIAGLWPLTSLRNAEFLANEVPGIAVPPAVIDRMRRADERGPEAASAEGVRTAQEMFDAVRGLVQGVQVSAPFGQVSLALEVLEGLAPARRSSAIR